MMLKSLIAAASVLVLMVCEVGSAAQDQAKAVVSVQVRNPSNQPLKDVPVTFGQVFRKGDIRQGVLAVVPKAGAQVDVKRTYDNGSVRFAVISVVLPEVAAGGETSVGLTDGLREQLAKPAPVQAADLLKTEFDAAVTLKFPDGAERSASARKLLEQAGGKARTWLQGACATEWLVDGMLAGKDGQPDPDLHAYFQVRAYAGCKYVRVSVVVENCWDDWAGNIGYDVAVTLGKDGKAVYEKKDVRHRKLSRWRKVFWWPAPPPEVAVVHDLDYLVSAGAVPNYDRGIKVSEQALARAAADWARNPEADIMGSGSLTKYMPTTGGRPEIGPYPSWAVRYLLSMDPRAKEVVLGNGDLGGSWPIHVRSRKTGRIMTIDDRPKFWMGGYKDNDGYERPKWKPDRIEVPKDPYSAEGKAYHLTPDCAHQPSLAYIPFLVTGDHYYMEEAYLWANYCLLAQWNAPRQNATGIMSDQIRGNAWGLRNIADAAFIAPGDDPEAKHFDEKIRNNIAHMTAKMLGPPEYNTMGFWGLRTVQDARIQNPPNPSWMITAPWEHDFLMWSLHHLTELGWAGAAKPRDFELRWRVGAFVHPDQYDPLLAAPYRMVVGEKGPDGKIVFYDDWKKLGEENAKLSKPGLGYAYSAQVALAAAVDAGFPRAEEALKVLNSLAGERLGGDPGWAIVPRKQPGKPAGAAPPEPRRSGNADGNARPVASRSSR